MKNIIILFLLSCSAFQLKAQVGIGTTTPNVRATLDISDTTKGLLIPRMTMSQKNAISNPPNGLLVYQIDSTNGFWYFDGSKWNSLKSTARDTGSTGGGIHMKIFTPGNYTWKVPSGVTSVLVEMWSGGGGGSGGGYTHCGGSGGAGAYGKGALDVVPGDIIALTIGAGGAGCQTVDPYTNFSCNGNDGGSTSFGNLMLATGGTKGIGALNGNPNLNGTNGTSGTCNAVLNCVVPCVTNLGIKYGLGGNGGCNNGTGSVGSSGNDGLLILNW